MSSSEQRNAEIWSTRLQRELLALTAGGAEDTADVAAVLPPFITLLTHELDIANGVCTVSFDIHVPTTLEEKIVVLLDVSLHHKPDGSVNAAAPAYPFQQPTVILQSGASCFPEGSTIKNGDTMDIDCDWTPSLHLTDAVLNVGLKVKESILQQEPFFAAQQEPVDPVEELAKGAAESARRFGSFLSKSVNKGAGIVAEAAAKPTKKKKTPSPKQPKKMATAENINIGDEINLLEAPWVDCQGVYSCKAIRRPAFVEDAIAVAAASKPEVRSSVLFDNDDGQVPDDFGTFMSLQAGSISKVCRRDARSSRHVVMAQALCACCSCELLSFSQNRWQVQALLELEPCFDLSENRQRVFSKSHSL